MSFLGGLKGGRGWTESKEDQYEDRLTGDAWIIRRRKNRDPSSPFKTVWTVTNDTEGDDYGEFHSEDEALAEIKKHVRPENLEEL